MAKEEVKAKAKIEGKDGAADKTVQVSCQYDFGSNLAGFIKKASKGGANGEAVAFSKVKASEKIDIQDLMRRMAAAGLTTKDIQEALDAHVPGVKKRGKSKAEKMKDDFDALSSEERTRLLSELAEA